MTPSRRLAHQLRARFDRHCLSLGLAVWPSLEAMPFDELVERMFASDRQAGRLSARWLPVGVAGLLWQRIVADDAELDPVLGRHGIARAAHRAWRRLHAWRIPVERLADDGSVESLAFARWAGTYQQLLDGRSWIDAAVATDRVSAAAAPAILRLVGFEAATPQQREFFARLGDAGRDVAGADPPAATGRCGSVACEDAADEVDCAVRWAAARLDGAPPERRVAIVVPDLLRRRDEVRRIAERVLAPASGVTGGPMPEARTFELDAAPPLTRAPVVAAALTWLGAMTSVGDRSTAARLLLRLPYTSGHSEEAPTRGALEAWLRRRRRSGVALGELRALCAERACPALAAALARGLDRKSSWSQKDLPSRWTERFFDLLEAVGWPAAPLDSAAQQAQERWRQVLAGFGACDEFLGLIGAVEALAELRRMTEAAPFQPESPETSVLILDAEAAAGLRVDALWICGLEASRWPPPASPDPFLPRSWQIRRGLPGASAELAERDARARLDRLRAAAAEVVLSAPRHDGEAALLPSALLAGVAALEPVDRWEAPTFAATLFASRPACECLRDDMPPAPAGFRPPGGARTLELQSACPFRAQAELRLGARGLEQPEPGLAAAERGELLHTSLRGLWSELGDLAALQSRTEPELTEAIRSAVAAAVASLRAAPGSLTARLLELEARWLESRIRSLLDWERRRPPFRVEQTETPVTLELGGLRFELRPDRLDRLADGRLAVIDYKTGAGADPGAWLQERPKLPQLPLYVEAVGPAAVSAVAFGRVRGGDTGYFGFARDPEAFPELRCFGRDRPPREIESWSALLAEWRRRLAALASEFAAGDARLAPDPRSACRLCHLQALCRIGEVLPDARDGTEAGEGEDE